MGKRAKHTWSDHDIAALINIRDNAIQQQKEGDKRALINIVHIEWKKRFPQSKATIGSLKICLSKIRRSVNISFTGPNILHKDNYMSSGSPVSNTQTTDDANSNMMTVNKIPTVRKETCAKPKDRHQPNTPGYRTKLSHISQVHSGEPQRRRRKGKLTQEMKDDVVRYYKMILNDKCTVKLSKDYIRRQTRRRWLQKYPERSISLLTIAAIVNLQLSDSRLSPIHVKEGVSEENNMPNIPDDSTRLRNMRKAAIHLSSEPIFKYVCYNCGRLLSRNSKRKHIVQFDINSATLSHPPVLNIFSSIGDLSYTDSTGMWVSCNHCRRGAIDLYNTCDPSTGKLYVPDPLKDLVSPYEKGQIALAGLISKIVKPRSDRRKIWEHIQGQIETRCKLDYHYFGMYGFMVAKEDKQGDVGPAKVQLHIKRALFWLRENNPLYTSFYANYDTLYRFDPDKVFLLHNASDFDANNHTTVQTHLRDEHNGLVTKLDDSGILPSLNPILDSAGVQHPLTIHNLNTTLHELKNLTRVSYADPYLEAKLWPHLFPFGTGGWYDNSLLKAGEYLKHKLLNLDARWRKDPSFSFHWYDRQMKSRLFYVARARRAKRNSRTDNLTSCKLQDQSFYEKLGNVVPTTITGSRSYWNSKLLDLLALSRKLGKPTFFITLTQNDNWPELQNHIINGPGHTQLEIDIDAEFELRDIHPSREFSVEMCTAYSNRLKLFKEEVISNPNGPLGTVVDWWDRKEFQSRGAIHNHTVVWCKEDTVPDNAVCAEVPRGAKDNPTVTSLKSFVRRLQMHRCRKDKCFLDSRGRPLKKCKYGFPYPVQNEEKMNKAGNRLLPRRRCYEDILVVPYNQEILYLWGAHMNIQKVTEAGWEMYLAKYVAKGEPSFKLDISKDASDPEKYLRTRVVGRLEVDHITLGYFLCCSRRAVTFLPTDLHPEYGYLKRNKHLPSDPDSHDVFYSNMLDKYMECPTELETISYVDWAENYTLARSSASDTEKQSTHKDNTQKSYIDLVGRSWKQRKTEAVARWKFFMPNGDDQEQYYMQKVVLNIPLRKDTPILSRENKSRTYLEDCVIRELLSEKDDGLNALHDARQRGFSIDRLRKMAQSLKDMDWIGEDEFNIFLEEVETIHNAGHMEDERELLDADMGTEDSNDLANLVIHSDRINLEEFESTLSPSQYEAYQYITQSLSAGQQVLTAIISEAGTGKSYLLTGLVDQAVTLLHLTARKLATTGVAAHLIGGETLHHFFQMDIHSKSRLETGTIEYDIINNTDLIIIDEFSLLELRPFLIIDKISRDMANAKNQEHMPFGGKHIILMGDPAQLPAIEQDIFDTFLWRKFDIVMLKDAKRQGDQKFQAILSTIRMGTTTHAIDSLLRSEVLPNIDIANIHADDAGAAIVCSLRKERDMWNNLFLQRIDGESHTFEAEDTDVTGNPLPEKEKHRIRWFHRERLEDKLTLKVGARVVLCKNIDTENGWLNGTIARVTNIQKTFITIVNIKTGRWTVVTRIRQNLSFPGSSMQHIRTQFPLILGWALPVHKVQGMTLNRAYIQLNRNFFASGQAYEALSRVKCIDDLQLLDYDPRAIFLDDYYKHLIQWMRSVDKIHTVPLTDTATPEYPKRCPKALTKSTGKRKRSKIHINGPYDIPPPIKMQKENTSSDHPIIPWHPNAQVQRHFTTSTNTNIFPTFPHIADLWRSIDLPLNATRHSYIVDHRQNFEVILDILNSIDVALFDSMSMIPDQHQQNLLHPILQSYLIAVETLGDGNCLFHSIWKQLFPCQQETAAIAKFMRQLTLFVIYNDEVRYRQMVTALGYIYSFDQYLMDIRQIGRFCGDLALSALSDALHRPIYCYNSFINDATGTFFFDDYDFDALTAAFHTRAQGTWQHNIFTPATIVNAARRPLKILFHRNHFTAILNTRIREDVVPQTNNFNINDVLQ